MDILKMLEQTGTIDQISRRYGISEQEIRSVVQESMPEIQSAINENTSTEQGYQNFMGAIRDHENDDLEGMIKDVGNVNKEDGDKIMTHLFGTRKRNVNEEVSRRANTSSNNTSMIIALLLPMILSMLGKSARQKNIYEDNRSGGGVFGDRNQTQTQNQQRNDGGILGDIFGGGSSSTSTRRNSPISDIGEAGSGRRYEADTRYREPNGYQERQNPTQPQSRGNGGLMDMVGDILTGQSSTGTSNSGGVLGSILGDLLRK